MPKYRYPAPRQGVGNDSINAAKEPFFLQVTHTKPPPYAFGKGLYRVDHDLQFVIAHQVHCRIASSVDRGWLRVKKALEENSRFTNRATSALIFSQDRGGRYWVQGRYTRHQTNKVEVPSLFPNIHLCYPPIPIVGHRDAGLFRNAASRCWPAYYHQTSIL